jgi:hypothetical protein
MALFDLGAGVAGSRVPAVQAVIERRRAGHLSRHGAPSWSRDRQPTFASQRGSRRWRVDLPTPRGLFIGRVPPKPSPSFRAGPAKLSLRSMFIWGSAGAGSSELARHTHDVDSDAVHLACCRARSGRGAVLPHLGAAVEAHRGTVCGISARRANLGIPGGGIFVRLSSVMTHSG